MARGHNIKVRAVIASWALPFFLLRNQSSYRDNSNTTRTLISLSLTDQVHLHPQHRCPVKHFGLPLERIFINTCVIGVTSRESSAVCRLKKPATDPTLTVHFMALVPGGGYGLGLGGACAPWQGLHPAFEYDYEDPNMLMMGAMGGYWRDGYNHGFVDSNRIHYQQMWLRAMMQPRGRRYFRQMMQGGMGGGGGGFGGGGNPWMGMAGGMGGGMGLLMGSPYGFMAPGMF